MPTKFEISNPQLEAVTPQTTELAAQLVNTADLSLAGLGEEARQRTVKANIKQITRRFGETAVKGETTADGTCLGGGMREVLAHYLDIKEFAGVLRALIPSTHQALQTLKDNQDYIIAWLDKYYEQEQELEPEAPKDPYLLARTAGYDLDGPFDSSSEFEKYKEDFRANELLCTFTEHNITNRLDSYYIMWLRRPEADLIKPADELTQDTLSKEWQDHLRAIGRYDPSTDSYNLKGLSPSREDPYGTSSMSVQVSRIGNHVSIKNRYNHTVSNPDNTFGNDLDNIAEGLKLAVYSKLGRLDLLQDQSAKLKDGYKADEKGYIHRFYYEKDNIYLGHYQYIESGKVTTIDKAKYTMLAPDLYISKNGTGQTIAIGSDHGLVKYSRISDDCQSVGVFNANQQLEKTYTFYNDNEDGQTKVEITIAEGAIVQSIHSNPAFADLTIAEGATAGYIYDNPALAVLTIAEGATVRDIFENPALAVLTIPEGATVRDIFENPALNVLTIPEGATVGDIFENPALKSLTIAEGATVGGVGVISS